MTSDNHSKSMDEALGAGLYWIIKALYFLLCAALVLLILRQFPQYIFPHGSGWHDLSNMEIFFLIGLTVLAFRFERKSNKYAWPYSSSVYRLIIAVGTQILVFLIGYVLITDPSGLESEIDRVGVLEFWLVIHEITLLLVLFAIAPTGHYRQKEAHSEEVTLEHNESQTRSIQDVT